MMDGEVKITGREVVIAHLQSVYQKISDFAIEAMKQITSQGAKEAKRNITDLDAVDTGALRASIEGNITNVNPLISISGEVVAGTNKVIRGTGYYSISKKTGIRVKPEPTSKYASDVEHGLGLSRRQGSRPFMTNTYNYLKAIAPNEFGKVLRKAIRRI